MNWSDCLTIIFVILALLGAYAFGEDHGKKITEHKYDGVGKDAYNLGYDQGYALGYERYLGGLDDRN